MGLTSERLRRRAAALGAVRAWFDDAGFLEVETPMLVAAPGLEPHIDPLKVTVQAGAEAAPEPRWLHTSPELALKKVLSELADEGEVGRVYQLARVFRDGEQGPLHRPEFTMLEWYRAPGTLEDLLQDIEGLVARVAAVLPSSSFSRALPGPLERVTLAELFTREAKVDLDAALDALEHGDQTALTRSARAAGHHVREDATFEDTFFHLMAAVIEPNLGQGTGLVVVERYPRSMAVLARLCPRDPRYALRFELYARVPEGGAVELANAFDELTDPEEQRARFEADNQRRRELGKPELPLDEDFLGTLGRLPPSAGIALGLDRLLMVLAGERSLDAVLGP